MAAGSLGGRRKWGCAKSKYSSNRYADEEALNAQFTRDSCASSPARLRASREWPGSQRTQRLLVGARLSSTRDDALVSLLALNGLRVPEALGA